MNSLQKAIGIGALVLTLASGCSGSAQTTGIIIEKRYEPARNYIAQEIRPAGGIVRYSVGDDEDFVITYKDGNGKEMEVYVSKLVYDSLAIGLEFDGARTPHEDHDPVVKTEIK